MSARCYLVCAAVSVAMHSLLAFSADHEPLPFSLQTASEKSERVSIALVSSPAEASSKKQAQEPKEPVTPVQKTRETIPEKPQEDARPQIQATKPALTKANALEKAATKAAPSIKKTPPPKKTAPAIKKPVSPKKNNENKKDHKKTNLADKKTMARLQSKSSSSVNQKESAPIQVEKPAFKVKPSPPKYPRLAKRKNMEGTVLIEIWLDEKGNQIKRVLIKSSSFRLLDNAAMTSVKQWRFKGYIEKGVPRAHRVRIPVLFKLDAS